MRQPWKSKPIVFRVVLGDATTAPAPPAPVPAAPPAPQRQKPSASPEAPKGPPWKKIATIAGASLLGAWLLRKTMPPMKWLERSRERARRMELEGQTYPYIQTHQAIGERREDAYRRIPASLEEDGELEDDFRDLEP